MPEIRPARRSDADLLARLIDIAGGGIPSYLWARVAEQGETAMEVGLRRAERDEGGFSWRNAHVAEVEGAAVAMLLGYRQPDPFPMMELSDLPEFLHPLVELEAAAPGSWYVNALAVLPGFRGRGLGSRLLDEADRCAARTRAPAISLIVDDDNAGAKRLYASRGFRETLRRAGIPVPGREHQADWVLMVRDLREAG